MFLFNPSLTFLTHITTPPCFRSSKNCCHAVLTFLTYLTLIIMDLQVSDFWTIFFNLTFLTFLTHITTSPCFKSLKKWCHAVSLLLLWVTDFLDIFFSIITFLTFLLIFPPYLVSDLQKIVTFFTHITTNLVCDLQKLLSCSLDLSYLSYTYYPRSQIFEKISIFNLTFCTHITTRLCFRSSKIVVTQSQPFLPILHLLSQASDFLDNFVFNLTFHTFITTPPCFRPSKIVVMQSCPLLPLLLLLPWVSDFLENIFFQSYLSYFY